MAKAEILWSAVYQDLRSRLTKLKLIRLKP